MRGAHFLLGLSLFSAPAWAQASLPTPAQPQRAAQEVATPQPETTAPGSAQRDLYDIREDDSDPYNDVKNRKYRAWNQWESDPYRSPVITESDARRMGLLAPNEPALPPVPPRKIDESKAAEAKKRIEKSLERKSAPTSPAAAAPAATPAKPAPAPQTPPAAPAPITGKPLPKQERGGIGAVGGIGKVGPNKKDDEKK